MRQHLALVSVTLCSLFSCTGDITSPVADDVIMFEPLYCNSAQDPYEWSASWNVYLQDPDSGWVDPTAAPGYIVQVYVRRHRYVAGEGDVAESWVEWPSVGGNTYIIDGVNGGKAGGEYWRWEMVTVIGTPAEPRKYVSRKVWLPDHLGCSAQPG